MISNYILGTIIRKTFLKEVGKFQEDKAMLLTFGLTCDFDKEEGYRDLDILIHAPLNYVQVWRRERWNVIPLEELDYDDDGEAFVKEGCDYSKGASKWELIYDHDSSWIEGVEDTLRKFEKRISSLSSKGEDWYTVVDPKEAMR